MDAIPLLVFLMTVAGAFAGLTLLARRDLLPRTQDHEEEPPMAEAAITQIPKPLACPQLGSQGPNWFCRLAFAAWAHRLPIMAWAGWAVAALCLAFLYRALENSTSERDFHQAALSNFIKVLPEGWFGIELHTNYPKGQHQGHVSGYRYIKGLHKGSPALFLFTCSFTGDSSGYFSRTYSIYDLTLLPTYPVPNEQDWQPTYSVTYRLREPMDNWTDSSNSPARPPRQLQRCVEQLDYALWRLYWSANR